MSEDQLQAVRDVSSKFLYMYMPSFLNELLIIFQAQVVVMQNLWEGGTVSTVFDLKVLVEARGSTKHTHAHTHTPIEPSIIHYP